jgi:mitochondrial import receptor subunit TOM40
VVQSTLKHTASSGADVAAPVVAAAAGMEHNPGSYEELHRKCKDVFPILFEGSKVMIQKGLSNHFQISHTLSLAPQLNSYRFGGTFVGTKQIGPQEVSTFESCVF